MGRNKIGRKAKKKVKVRASYATIDEIKIIGGESGMAKRWLKGYAWNVAHHLEK